MKLPAFLQPRILRQAVKALFSPPFTTRFPAEPFEASDRFRGRPRFNEKGCIGCGACAEVCPPKCIDVIDDTQSDPPRRHLVQHLDACIWCGQCARHCPTGTGIRMSNEYAAIGFAPKDFEETVSKEILLCEVCGEVIGPIDQLRWLARNLGAVAFANPTLMMMAEQDLGLVEPGVKSAGGEVLRGDRLSVHCSKCRRETAHVA